MSRPLCRSGFGIQVHYLGNAMAGQAGFQLGQRVVDDQPSRHGHGEPFFPLMNFPGEGLARQRVAKQEAFMGLRLKLSRGFGLSPAGNIGRGTARRIRTCNKRRAIKADGSGSPKRMAASKPSATRSPSRSRTTTSS